MLLRQVPRPSLLLGRRDRQLRPLPGLSTGSASRAIHHGVRTACLRKAAL